MDVTPAQEAGFNVRTRVHEYGGACLIFGPDTVYFSNFKCAQPWLTAAVSCLWSASHSAVSDGVWAQDILTYMGSSMWSPVLHKHGPSTHI